MTLEKKLAQKFNTGEDIIKNIIALIDEGNTLPFIARYRKEQTGGIDDQLLREIDDALRYLRALAQRKEEIISLIEAQGKLTDEILSALEGADTLAKAEDVYRPFKQKKQTRAGKARAAGLLPLAEAVMAGEKDVDVYALAAQLAAAAEMEPDAALSGALDIIAEDFSDSAALRDTLRGILQETAMLISAGKTEEETVYSRYYEYSEITKNMPSHRILAINRGESEGILKVSFDYDTDRIKSAVYAHAQIGERRHRELITRAADDSLSRLILPSLERELRSALTDRANEAAIKAFSKNLTPLFMQPPVKGRTVLGLDPGFRTGCKAAVVDGNGKVLDTTVLYITHSETQKAAAAKTLLHMIKKHAVTAIAIGNGTASRETERFVADTIAGIPEVAYTIVNEAGASVYSASPLAAKELPNLDLTLRSAASIARRLQDPLAELVKIEPKAIGVGQYQHDMPKTRLESALSGAVEDCVNSVGVDLNTASSALLSYVAGITPSLAEAVVSHREENGAFRERKELLKVKKLGKKAFTQCAGFLRIKGGKNPLDATAVHPESYALTKELLLHLGISEPLAPALIERAVDEKGGAEAVARELRCGAPTLSDIITELKKPGRDPRDELPPVLFHKDVLDIKDIKEGMKLSGTVRNVTDFGAFVDIGVHEDGLVHISQLADRYVKHPSDVVKTGDRVEVKVLSVDPARRKISLTMRQ